MNGTAITEKPNDMTSPDNEKDLSIHTEPSISITRPIYTQDDVNERLDGLEGTLGKKPCCKVNCSLAWVMSFFPIISTVRNYKLREYVVNDLLGGLTAACLHLPQGLAFGMLASLAPEYGLYTSFFPVLFYMIFGTSHHVSLGTNAVIALATAELVETAGFGQDIERRNTSSIENNTSSTAGIVVGVYTDADLLADKAALAAGASFVCGAILTAMGLCRLGVITTYLSSSFIGGFTTAAAFHIFSSQVSKALGIKIPMHQGIGKLILTYLDIFKGIPNVNVCSLITAIITAIVLLLVKECINERFREKMRMPVPIDFIVVVAATVISHFADFHSRFGMNICGHIPTGVPAPVLPSFKPFDVLLPKAVEISVLVFFITISIAKLLATRHNYDIDDNKELLAYGLSNVGSSFFLCFPSAIAPPRSMLLSLMGAKTTLNNAFTSVIILACLLVIGQLFSSLPVSVLATMVMVAVTKLLLQVTQLPSIYRINGYDFIIWVVTCSTAVFLDLVYGLVCGLVVSLFVVALQSQRVKPIQKMSQDNTELLMGKKLDNVFESTVIVTVQSSLYFATAGIFLKKMRSIIEPETKQEMPMESYKMTEIQVDEKSQNNCIQDVRTGNDDSKRQIKYIIVDLRQVNYIDMKGLQALTSICKFYETESIEVILCECTHYMQQILNNSDFYKSFPRDRMLFTLCDAIEEVRHDLLKTNIPGILWNGNQEKNVDHV